MSTEVKQGRKRATNSLSELTLRAAQFTGPVDENRGRRCKIAVNYKETEHSEEEDPVAVEKSKIRPTWTDPEGNKYFIIIVDPRPPGESSKVQIDKATTDASKQLTSTDAALRHMSDTDIHNALLSMYAKAEYETAMDAARTLLAIKRGA